MNTIENKLIFFDVDGTLTREQTHKLLINFLYKNGLISLLFFIKTMVWFLAYKLHIISNPKDVMKLGYKFVENKTPEEIDYLLEKFIKELPTNFFYKKMLDKITQHKNQKERIVLISNLSNPILSKIAKNLKIDDYIGTELEIIDGKYTGNINVLMDGKEKAIAIKKYMNNFSGPKKISAYGDRFSDRHMLELASKSYVVNPRYRLKKLAIKNNWSTLYLE